MTDDGLEFYARASDGTGTVSQFTGERRAALLAWIDERRREGGWVLEVGMKATTPTAVQSLLIAMAWGQAVLERQSTDRM